MTKKNIISLLFFLFAFFNVEAQVQGDFVSANFLKYKNKTYTQVVDLVTNKDNGFYSCFESYEYLNGVFKYETDIYALNHEGKIITDLLNQGTLKIELKSFKDIRVKQLLVDNQSRILVLANVLVDEVEGIRKGIVLRYNNDGILDLSFNALGYRVLDTHFAHSNNVNKFVFDADFNLYAVGMAINPKEEYDPFPVVYKVFSNGTLDLSFNNTGYYVFQSLPAFPNARVSHVAGGELKTINLDGLGRVVVAGSLAKGLERFNFISRLSSSGKLDESFFDKGFCLVNPNEIGVLSFRNSISLKDNSILFALEQNSNAYNVFHAHLDDHFKVYERDVFFGQDFLVSMIQIDRGVFGIVNTLDSEDFNILNKPNHNYIIKLYDGNGKGVVEPEFELYDLELGSVELQKIVYLSLDQAFIVGGKVFDGNQFQSFLYKIESKKVGLESELTSNFLLFPSITNSHVEISMSSSFLAEEVRIYNSLGLEMLVTSLPTKVDIRSWKKGIYYVKSNQGFDNKFIVY